MSIPTLRPVKPAPRRGDPENVFESQAAEHLGSLVGFSEDMSTVLPWMQERMTSAATSATGASASAASATSSATSASTSATKASQWADANENVAVETGKFSAKHHAAKAAASAAEIRNTELTSLSNAQAAAASATQASTSATNAASSASSASASAATATTKAGEAATSATNAAASATSASASAATATTKAGEAATSAANAASSATSASASAATATTKAGEAATSATNAAASATSASGASARAVLAETNTVAARALVDQALQEDSRTRAYETFDQAEDAAFTLPDGLLLRALVDGSGRSGWYKTLGGETLALGLGFAAEAYESADSSLLLVRKDTSRLVDVPETSTSAALPGDYAIGADFMYFATGVNQWKRLTLEAW